jgi:MYND finger
MYCPYVVYKPVLRLTVHGMESIQDAVSLPTNRQRTSKALAHLMQMIERSKAGIEREVFQKLGTVYCDNLKVRDWPPFFSVVRILMCHVKCPGSSSSPATRSRECSQCTSARYCSRACQKADWYLHKYECSHRKRMYRLPLCLPYVAMLTCCLEEPDRQVWVSHFAKFALTHHIESLVRPWSAAQIPEVGGIVKADMRFSVPSIQSVPVILSSDEVDAPAYILPRIDEYIERARGDPALQLAMGLFAHGTYTLHLMVLFGSVNVVGVTSYVSQDRPVATDSILR